MRARCRAGPLRLLLCVVLLPCVARDVAGQQARLTIDVLPGSGARPALPRVTFELLESKRLAGLPGLTLATSGQQPRLTQFRSLLPRLAVGGLSLTPTYGDERWAMPFPAASLSGLGVDPRSLRGLLLTGKAGTIPLSIAVGQIGGRAPGLVASAVPRVVAVTSSLTPHRLVSIVPRALLPFGRSYAPGAAAAAFGVGGRVGFAPGVALIADLGATRQSGSGWAPGAAAGLVGSWRRTSFEANASRAAGAYELAGPVGFAGRDRELLSSSLRVGRGVTILGRMLRTRPHAESGSAGRRQKGSGEVTRAVVIRADRGVAGVLTIGHEQTTERSRQVDGLTSEWRGVHAGWESALRLLVQREVRPGQPPVTFRELFVQSVGSPPAGRRIGVDGRVTIALSSRPPGASRMQWRLVNRSAVTRRISLGTESEGGLFNVGCARPRAPCGQLHRLLTLKLVAEIAWTSQLSIRVSYGHAPGAARPFIQRWEGRIVRTLP